jgi:hypothetical protein
MIKRLLLLFEIFLICYMHIIKFLKLLYYVMLAINLTILLNDMRCIIHKITNVNPYYTKLRIYLKNVTICICL